MTQTRNDFTKGAIPGLVTRMALPIIGAQIVNALYNIVDRMYIGRLPGVGSLALTGVGVTFPLILLISAFAQLSGMGGAPLCSIARGEGKDEYAERILGTSFSLLLLFGAVAMGAGYAFKAPLLYFFGASDNTFPYADSYMQVYLAGTVFVMLAMGLNPFVNSQGFTRYSMLVMMAGAVANIALDPLFMFVLGMGIRGAALATVLSQGLCAFLMLRFLTGPRCLIRLRVRNLRPRAKIVKRVLALGASSCTMNVTECIVAVVCNRTLRAYGGDVYVGVMTVISSVRQVLMMPVSGFGQGLQPVIGYNYGARRYDRVRQGVKFTTLVSMAYASAVCAATVFLPGFFLRLFSQDEALIAAGIPSMRLYFCLFFMLSFQMAGQYSFVALGKSRQAMFFSLLRKAFIVAPLALLLPRFTSLGVMGVFAAEPVSDFVGSLACFLTFMFTVWPALKDGKKELVS